MKILKIFGIVVGIHVFALVLIFANPGCSATSKSGPAPADTTAPMSTASAPAPAPTAPSGYGAPAESAPITFNPDAPATAASGGAGVRFSPTRPGMQQAPVQAPVTHLPIVSEPVVDVNPASTHTVKSGDSLWSIAKKHNLTVSELAAANNMAPGAALRPNQKLLIPGKAASASVAATATGKAGSTPKAEVATPTASTSRGSEGVKHTVKSGETLGTIARKYDVKQGDIAVANNISDPAKIRAGMELTIPGWQTPSGKSGKSVPKAAPKNGEQRNNSVDTVPSLPSGQPPPPPSVPIIRIDEGPSPITPAPRP